MYTKAISTLVAVLAVPMALAFDTLPTIDAQGILNVLKEKNDLAEQLAHLRALQGQLENVIVLVDNIPFVPDSYTRATLAERLTAATDQLEAQANEIELTFDCAGQGSLSIGLCKRVPRVREPVGVIRFDYLSLLGEAIDASITTKAAKL